MYDLYSLKYKICMLDLANWINLHGILFLQFQNYSKIFSKSIIDGSPFLFYIFQGLQGCCGHLHRKCIKMQIWWSGRKFKMLFGSLVHADFLSLMCCTVGYFCKFLFFRQFHLSFSLKGPREHGVSGVSWPPWLFEIIIWKCNKKWIFGFEG